MGGERLRLYPAEVELGPQPSPILRDKLPALVLPLFLCGALPATQRLHGLELVLHVSLSASSLGRSVVVAERGPLRRMRRSRRRRLGSLIPKRRDWHLGRSSLGSPRASVTQGARFLAIGDIGHPHVALEHGRKGGEAACRRCSPAPSARRGWAVLWTRSASAALHGKQ